jgi:metal-responsive CopG/Arc/MetJ family transcriptional regulator
MAEEKDPAQTGVTETEKIKSITAGLFESDYTTLQNLMEEMSLSRSQVVRTAIRNFLRRHQAGEISLKAEGGTLTILSNAPASASKPAAKTSRKKKKAAGTKKDKKKKKRSKSAKKKK